MTAQHFLLGVTGGVAAYKSAELVRLLQERGHIFAADPDPITEALRHAEDAAHTRYAAPITVATGALLGVLVSISSVGAGALGVAVLFFLYPKLPAIRIVGAQPSEGSRIPGIRKWPQEYLPKIYDASTVDELVYVSQDNAEDMCRRLAREEGIFAGISAAGACWVAQQIAARGSNATIVFIVCDRGDRYLSTGVFPA